MARPAPTADAVTKALAMDVKNAATILRELAFETSINETRVE